MNVDFSYFDRDENVNSLVENAFLNILASTLGEKF